ncbi:tRNA modification GTPase GTPBP3 [Hysterangium stoloniferum]|nr:tRNA modification GTPase GTPBP3 [Hysterangium stoloniferum]
MFSRVLEKQEFRLSRLFRSQIHTKSNIIRSPAENTTIYALSTPPGKGGVAVIRVSGPAAAAVWQRIVRPISPSKWTYPNKYQIPRSALMHRCLVIDPDAEESLDDGLAIMTVKLSAPHSFTTESTLELHLHSSPAILRRVFSVLSRVPGLRPAERGEFTKRAYLAGKLNLLEAEGLRDLIEAETETQRKVAWRSFNGSVGTRYDQLREDIVGALAMIEAIIDFGDAEEIEEGTYEGAHQRVRKLHEDIRLHLHDSHRGEILRSGIKISIFGPPNVGKSSLLNYFAQRDAAIVTPIPGTTRDVLEITLDIAGLPVRVFDTAGIRRSDDLVEKMGIERARKIVHDSDINLCVLSLPEALKGPPLPATIELLFDENTLVLYNKADLVGDDVTVISDMGGRWTRTVSVTTGFGMQEFVQDLGRILKKRYDFRGDDMPLVTHNRHKVHLENAMAHLNAFLDTSHAEIVVAAEELRYAAQEIGKITGRVGVEDILDAVFREFCIGK